MCGIAGISRNPNGSSIPDARKFARSLSYAIESRGRDATGFGWAGHDGTPWFWKSAGDAYRVAGQAPLPQGMQAVVVHTRHATQGSPKVNSNNHPVVAPGVVLVHNGRVQNDADLLSALGYARTATVDSEALAALVSSGGDVFNGSSITDLLTLVEGPTACAWLDVDQPTVLHLARLRARPLAYGFTKRGDFVFASTPAALKHTSSLTNVAINDIETVPEGTYLRVEGGTLSAVLPFVPASLPKAVPSDLPTSTPRRTWSSKPTNRPQTRDRSVYSETGYYSKSAFLARLEACNDENVTQDDLDRIERRYQAKALSSYDPDSVQFVDFDR